MVCRWSHGKTSVSHLLGWKNIALPYCVLLSWESSLLLIQTTSCWAPNVWRFSPHRPAILHISSFPNETEVSKNSTKFWHCVPGESIRFRRLRVQSRLPKFHLPLAPTHTLQTQTASPGYSHLCFNQLAIDRGFQQCPPWVQWICGSGSPNSWKHIYQFSRGYDKGYR